MVSWGQRPRHDPTPRLPRKNAARTFVETIVLRSRRPRRPGTPGAADEPAPVRPDRPLDLSGGAAAALPLDD